MMKGILDLKGALSAGLLLLLINIPAFAADLIEPSRTLSSPAESAGELSVFSEPPELDINMDGTQIGKTPVVGQKVEPGIHVIRIKDSETEIYVERGKLTKLSWFKGAFIEIPAEVVKSRKQQGEEKKEVPHTRVSEQLVEKKEKPDPLYWPLNPKGPIN
jgi:hypothetical protein